MAWSAYNDDQRGHIGRIGLSRDLCQQTDLPRRFALGFSVAPLA